MRLKAIPQRLGYILSAQWARDLSWTLFTILLSRQNPWLLGQIVLAISYGYLVKTVADAGLNEFLSSSFARRDTKPSLLLSEVTWLKFVLLFLAIFVTAIIVITKDNYNLELQIIILCIAAGFGLDGVSDSFFALCQARGRQDIEMRIRIPAAILGIGFGIICLILSASPIFIACYKIIESLLCFIFALRAIGRNPFEKFSLDAIKDLAKQLQKGVIFTVMSICAMVYNKINVFFLKDYADEKIVAAYGMAWEMVDGLSLMISSALLGKVIFPLLSKLWKDNKEQFHQLSGQTARTLWAAALPLMYLLWVENDRIFPLIYGPHLAIAIEAQKMLLPCIATAFLHNLAAYVMIGMQEQKTLLVFYISGLVINIICCFWLIPLMPLEGAALTLTLTKVWVAILTVSFFQIHVKPMTLKQWLILISTALLSLAIWQMSLKIFWRELSEILGLLPLIALFWSWRPPSLFEKS